MKQGNTIRVTREDNVPLTKTLPVGTYVVKLDPNGYYLDRIDPFVMPPKLYGNTLDYSGRIFNTFKDRSGPTGVMLTGEKGSGKTLLAKHLSLTAAEHGYSTIVVNDTFTDDGFHTLIQSIDQPAVIMFDEFEKVYDDTTDQQSVLTLLDGIFNSKKLFVLTCNDRWRVDVHMRNRPGRLYYMLDFDGLDTAFVREYCEDNLANKDHIEKVCNVSLVFDRFNFDMLKAIVEEMNRYNETPQQVLRMINARPEFSNNTSFDVTLFHSKRQVEAANHSTVWDGNPLSVDGIELSVLVPNENAKTDKDPKTVWSDVFFMPEDLVKIDPNAGTFTFTHKDNWTMVLTRQKPKSYQYIDL
jgi:hypothetical protein